MDEYASQAADEKESCAMSIEEVRQAVREYAKSIGRVDAALRSLKPQLIDMREQDLHLLKQLIQIRDSTRKLTRSSDRRSGKRSSHRATREFMTSAVDLSVTLRRFKGRSGSLFGGGEYNTVPLVRRQSEPQVCMLSPNSDVIGDVRSWNSRRGSGSSADWWSEDTLGSSDDGRDTFGSDDNLDDTTTSFNTTTEDADTSTLGRLTLAPEPPQDCFLRPKSHSVVAATFLSRPKLSGGNNSYSDILNQNVRLWKNRLEHAQGVRQRVSILEEEMQADET